MRPGALIRSLIAFALVAASSCGQSTPDGDEEPEPVGPATNADELLSIERLPRFDITVGALSLASLEAAPKEWASGSFEYGGVVYDNVGVRLKGNHSFQPLSGKPSFKIKFNKYEAGRRFLGLEGLTLNAMVVDGSMLREWISYRVFRKLDVPAPRAGFAEVWVNGEYYGLYLDLEPYDDEFLERAFDDPSGNLYESDKSADLDRDIEEWDQDEGSDESRDDLVAFSELALREGNEVFYGSEAAVDLPNFYGFLAGEAIVGHFDGHMSGHNFFVYHEPTADLWTYLPWSLDQSWRRHVTPFEHRGYLGSKCMHDERCVVEYVLQAQAALARFDRIDLDEEFARAIELTDDAMRADRRKPYSDDHVENERDGLSRFAVGRSEELEPQLDCLVGGAQPDADGDGYGPCFEDCNDSDPSINPDAVELCDGIDNDCTGFADDVPSCECPSFVSEGRTFYFCDHHISWLQARDFCEDQGHVLARFDSAAQLEEVWAQVDEIGGGRWAIGLNDREVEDEYRWLDGSAPGFSAWAAGQPAHRLEWFDCVFARSGAWYECNCIEKGSFICTDDN